MKVLQGWRREFQRRRHVVLVCLGLLILSWAGWNSPGWGQYSFGEHPDSHGRTIASSATGLPSGMRPEDLYQMGQELAIYVAGLPREMQVAMLENMPEPVGALTFWSLNSNETRKGIMNIKLERMAAKLPPNMQVIFGKIMSKYELVERRYTENYRPGSPGFNAEGGVKAFYQSLTREEINVLNAVSRMEKRYSGGPYFDPTFLSQARITKEGREFLMSIRRVSPTAERLLGNPTLFEEMSPRTGRKFYDNKFLTVSAHETDTPEQMRAAPCHCVEGHNSTCNDFANKNCRGEHCTGLTMCTIFAPPPFHYWHWKQPCNGVCAAGVQPIDNVQY